MIEKLINSVLRADARVSALVGGRIGPVASAQGTLEPRIVFERVSTEREGSTTGASLLAQARVQVTCYDGRKDNGAENYASVRAIADAVRKALDGYRGEAAGVKSGGIMLIDERDQPTDPSDGSDKRIQGVSLDFLCWFVDGPPTATLTLSIAAGERDAHLDSVGPTWHADSTTLQCDAARTAFLQFLVPLPRFTPIFSASLILTPSATNATVPATFRTNFAALFDGDLSVDRSSLLAGLDAANESEAITASWTLDQPVTLDVTHTIDRWLLDDNVPLDDSGAFCTITLQKTLLNLYRMYAFEHATGPAAQLIIEHVTSPFGE